MNFGGAMLRKGGVGIVGFSVRFDRHQRWWEWREQFPDANARKLKHVTEGRGFRSRSEAVAAVRGEVERREAALAAAAARSTTKRPAKPKPISVAVAARARRRVGVHQP